MKKLIFSVLAILFLQTGNGQDIIISGGGAGHFTIGPSLVFSKSIQDYLKEPHVLGSSYDGTPWALQIGGEGYAMINKFLVGGGGFALSGFKTTANDGNAMMGGAGGYFKTGYRIFSGKTNFTTINASIGGFGYPLELENKSAENGVAFNRSAPIEIGKKNSYSFRGMLLDLGFGNKSMVIGSRNEDGFGGFLLGMDAGCMLSVPFGDWKADNETSISGPPDPDYVWMPYLRLTIGGGGFGYRK